MLTSQYFVGIAVGLLAGMLFARWPAAVVSNASVAGVIALVLLWRETQP